MYKLILADGTELTGFTKNGEITDGEETITMHNAELIQQVEDADGFHICFRELSAQELQNKVTESNVTDIQVALAELYEMIVGGV